MTFQHLFYFGCSNITIVTIVCKIPLLARRTRPKAPAGQARRATIGYLVYNRYNVTGQSQESEESSMPAKIKEVHCKLHLFQVTLCTVYTRSYSFNTDIHMHYARRFDNC